VSAAPPNLTDFSRTRRPIIIVAPFVAFSRGNDERSLADSIAQDISVQLSRFSWFEVADFLRARNLSDNHPAPLEIASRFHADFLLGGTIHKQGPLLRLTVQLTHTDSGRILWAERFTIRTGDEQLRQHDDIVERVAARVGDTYGVLATSVLGLARRKPREQVTLCEAVLANLRYQLHLADGMFAKAFQNAELAIAADPEFAWGWAALSLLHMDNYVFAIDPSMSDSAESALYCIRQALRADAECGLAHFSQGLYHLTRGEAEQCIAAAERTAEFAHGSPFETAGAGGLLAMAGEHERSQPLMAWAIRNNPGLPGWVHWASTVNHLKQGEHRQALAATQRYSLPECFWDHLFRATTQFIAGDEGQAKLSSVRAEQLRPRLADQRRDLVSRLVPQPDLQQVLIDELPRL
jgi:TolB-like protein